MSLDLNNLLTLLLGGGLATIVTLVVKAVREWREGRTAREDTAISRWKELAKEYKAEGEAKSQVIRAYRRVYPRLWSAYMGKPGSHLPFPSDPTQPEDDLYDTLPTSPAEPDQAP